MAVPSKRKTDIGPPHYEQFLPQVIKDNYGKWKYHEIPRPGVLLHVSETGAKLWSVRAAASRLLSIETIRLFADLADEFCGGHLRFTSRNNVEFLVTDEAKVDPLIARLKKEGYPVGGTGPSITNIVHTQGWVHCHSAAATHRRREVRHGRPLLHFEKMDLPAKLRIAFRLLPEHVRRRPLLGHRHPGRAPKAPAHPTTRSPMCEIPTTVAACPTGAIRPATVDGKPVGGGHRRAVHVLRQLLHRLPGDDR
jgi:sulfite reductase beta subunit